MGQATLDLPDPLETPAAPSTSADDLLSQLAGDEIDRLLAETETEPADTSSPYTGADSDSAPQAPESTNAEATEQAATANDQPSHVASMTAASQSTQVASDLDELFRTMDANASASRNAASTAGMSDASAAVKELDEALANQTTDALPDVASSDSEMTSDERSALNESGQLVDQSHDFDEEPAQLPIFLRPLVWLNLPLLVFPEAVRQTVGKVAILTLCNAIAVLAYVLIFRRHH